MDQRFQTIKTYIINRKEMMIGIGITVCSAALVIAIVLFIQNNTPKVVYQPAKACDLFTLSDAQSLLGANALKSGTKDTVISGNTAISKCGYTDNNANTDEMVVAAIIVRSGVNDNGVQQNKTEFESSKPTKNSETVNGLGDKAFFNQTLGQLNILNGREWIILSYGVGSTPENNTVEKATELARVVIR